jgi:hypothetical protein
VIVEHGGRRQVVIGLLDTGADVCLLPYRKSHELGVMLGAPRTIGTATGQSVSYRPGALTLEIRSATETVRWRAEVGFTAAPLSVPVFGDRGFLEYFRSEFDGQFREIELTPKPNIPRSG